MNQILMFNDKKGKKAHGPAKTSSIVRFFAIALIIFGLFSIAQGSYAIYKDIKGSNTEDLPLVKMTRVNDTVILEVNSKYLIENLVYSWNDYEETAISVEDTYVKEEILLPIENSVLNLAIEDETGRRIKYQREFLVEGMDITEPTIEIREESTQGNIRIMATDETAIAYISYKVNDEDEFIIRKSNLEENIINYVLKLQRGENKIVVTAVDEAGNTETIEKTIIVSGRTSINLKIENGKLIIIAEDPDGIKDIEINLNGVVYSGKDINQKAVRVPIELTQETNTVRITITNVNSLVTVGTKEFNYAR